MALHYDFSLIALIGVILLVGIVKKNAIMMIDFALEGERKRQLTPEAAIYEASLLRFRPIMMTTMAALLGGLPLALGTGAGSELRRPLGIAIVGGLLLSQLLTLYTTPVVYIYMSRIARLLQPIARAHRRSVRVKAPPARNRVGGGGVIVSPGRQRAGLFTRTMARVHLTDMVADDDLVCPPPVPACDYPARRLALRPIFASYRDVEDLRAERGPDVSYETVRRWVLKFGPLFARELRRRRPRPTARWDLDEMAVMIAGHRSGCGARLTRKARFSTYSCNGDATRLQP